MAHISVSNDATVPASLKGLPIYRVKIEYAEGSEPDSVGANPRSPANGFGQGI